MCIRDSVQIGRHRRDEGLPLARTHLSDRPAVEGARPDDLNIERALAEGALCGLANDGECFFLEIVERFAGAVPIPELNGLCHELRVAQRFDLRLPRVDTFGAVSYTH